VNGAGGTRTLETVSRDDMADSFKAAFPDEDEFTKKKTARRKKKKKKLRKKRIG
jgi:hypothetical protein